MSLTLPGWLLIASSIAIAALLILMLRSDAPRLALLSRLQPLRSGLGQDRRASMLIVGAAVFVLVAGIGSATSYFRDPAEAVGAGGTSPSHSGPNGEMLASLKDYTRSVGAEDHAPLPAGGKLLPDVNTMIEKLAARLDTAPKDIQGWRMLGWSYFNMGRYAEAAAAYGRAVELDPESAELKTSYDQAKTKASENGNSAKAASLPAGGVGKGGDAAADQKSTKSEAKGSGEYDAAIRAMVDGLAGRLESSPRDVEGWTRLMRSRVVLGEREVATTALRKALEVFKGDSAATGKITAAATELGLKAE